MDVCDDWGGRGGLHEQAESFLGGVWLVGEVARVVAAVLAHQVFQAHNRCEVVAGYCQMIWCQSLVALGVLAFPHDFSDWITDSRAFDVYVVVFSYDQLVILIGIN